VEDEHRGGPIDGGVFHFTRDESQVDDIFKSMVLVMATLEKNIDLFLE